MVWWWPQQQSLPGISITCCPSLFLGLVIAPRPLSPFYHALFLLFLSSFLPIIMVSGYTKTTNNHNNSCGPTLSFLPSDFMAVSWFHSLHFRQQHHHHHKQNHAPYYLKIVVAGAYKALNQAYEPLNRLKLLFAPFYLWFFLSCNNSLCPKRSIPHALNCDTWKKNIKFNIQCSSFFHFPRIVFQ